VSVQTMSRFPKYPEGDSPVITHLHPVCINWWERIEPKA
jgi:hypothetical protein